MHASRFLNPPFLPLVDIDQYCARIGFAGSREPTLATLQTLVNLHTQVIPFENLTPLSGLPVELSTSALTHKLLHSRRGGYCFEHNLLLWNVLQQLGFVVQGLAARVRWQAPADTQTALTHMLLWVSINEIDHVVDVGFGGSTPSVPLQLAADIEQRSEQDLYRLVAQHDMHELQLRMRDAWWPMYQFNLTPYLSGDYQIMNWYTSTSPDSKFTRTLSAARCAESRRHTLRDNLYTCRHANGTEQRTLLTHSDDIKHVLNQQFHITVPASATLDAQLARIAALPAS